MIPDWDQPLKNFIIFCQLTIHLPAPFKYRETWEWFSLWPARCRQMCQHFKYQQAIWNQKKYKQYSQIDFIVLNVWLFRPGSHVAKTNFVWIKPARNIGLTWLGVSVISLVFDYKKFDFVLDYWYNHNYWAIKCDKCVLPFLYIVPPQISTLYSKMEICCVSVVVC